MVLHPVNTNLLKTRYVQPTSNISLMHIIRSFSKAVVWANLIQGICTLCCFSLFISDFFFLRNNVGGWYGLLFGPVFLEIPIIILIYNFQIYRGRYFFYSKRCFNGTYTQNSKCFTLQKGKKYWWICTLKFLWHKKRILISMFSVWG